MSEPWPPLHDVCCQCAGCPPYSHEQFQRAKALGLDLDNWRDYEQFMGLGDNNGPA